MIPSSMCEFRTVNCLVQVENWALRNHEHSNNLGVKIAA